MRAIIHLIVMAFHYGMFVTDADTVAHHTPVPVFYLTHVLAMYCFAVTFVINGINSGRWLTRQLSARSSCVRVTCKFYWQRLTAIISITYVYYAAFTMSNLVVFKSSLLTAMLWDSLWPNLLFVSNYVSIESNVSIGWMCKSGLIWVKVILIDADIFSDINKHIILFTRFIQFCGVTMYSFN